MGEFQNCLIWRRIQPLTDTTPPPATTEAQSTIGVPEPTKVASDVSSFGWAGIEAAAGNKVDHGEVTFSETESYVSDPGNETTGDGRTATDESERSDPAGDSDWLLKAGP